MVLSACESYDERNLGTSRKHLDLLGFIAICYRRQEQAAVFMNPREFDKRRSQSRHMLAQDVVSQTSSSIEESATGTGRFGLRDEGKGREGTAPEPRCYTARSIVL
jgi:hypothetical protein